MKNFLIPTDLSECTKSTIKYAVNLGIKSKAKLFFYHANEKKEISNSVIIKDLVKKSFSDLNVNFKDFQTEFITEACDFSNQNILKLSADYSIDLIIMGASHDGIKTTFFGSHVSDFINDANCPVLSVPHSYNYTDIDTIGFASTLYDLKTRIKEIIPFARLLNAGIEIFHVYPVFPQKVDVKKYNSEKILAQIKFEYSYDKINFCLIKTPFMNEPVTGIREFVNSHNPDILVMYHKPRGLFDKLVLDFGTTISVVKTSPVPVLALTRKTACKIM